MNQILTALLHLANEAYPELPKLTEYGKWLAGKFEPPCLFVHVRQEGELPDTLQTNRKHYTGLFVLHFPKNAEGFYQPIETEPLTEILRRERFMYPTLVDNKRVVLTISQENYKIQVNDRGDRIYITFPIQMPVKIPTKNTDKLQNFHFGTGE